MLLGILVYIAFKWIRAVRSGEWDTSNLLNLFRYESYHAMYPGYHARMFILSEEEVGVLAEAGYHPVQPYSYVSKDEFSENFPHTRP